jgi:hypothetical protein
MNNSFQSICINNSSRTKNEKSKTWSKSDWYNYFDNQAQSVRSIIRYIRDPKCTAYDIIEELGCTVGEFSNFYVNYKYNKKKCSKRKRARELRKRRKQHMISFPVLPKKKIKNCAPRLLRSNR